jgi:hypothetical protein
MGLLGANDAPVTLLRHMGWGFESLFAWGGVISRGILDLTRGWFQDQFLGGCLVWGELSQRHVS